MITHEEKRIIRLTLDAKRKGGEMKLGDEEMVRFENMRGAQNSPHLLMQCRSSLLHSCFSHFPQQSVNFCEIWLEENSTAQFDV